MITGGILLGGITAGTALSLGYKKYLTIKTREHYENKRNEYFKNHQNPEALARLQEFDKKDVDTVFNNARIRSFNPNSIIRSNRKSHKLFQSIKNKFKPVTEQKAYTVHEAAQFDEQGKQIKAEREQVDYRKEGKNVVSYDYMNDTPDYILSYTNSIFGHFHAGLKEDMKVLRDTSAKHLDPNYVDAEGNADPLQKEKKETLEYKILVESQKDIQEARNIKNSILNSGGFFHRLWRKATQKFGNISKSGRAVKRLNTIKKIKKTNIALYQQTSLKAYRELYKDLADEKKLLDASSEQVIEKYDSIMLQNVGKKKEKDNLSATRMFFDPEKLFLDQNKNIRKVDKANQGELADFAAAYEIYSELMQQTLTMRNHPGDASNYLTIIKCVKRYQAELMRNRFLDDSFAMCHKFFKSGTLRRAMSAGKVDGTDENVDEFTAEDKKMLNYARIMLTQCLTQVMFDNVNKNTNVLFDMSEFGKLNGAYQVSKLAASAVMNRVDFQQALQENMKEEGIRDVKRVHANVELMKKRMAAKGQPKEYEKYIDLLLSKEAQTHPDTANIIEDMKDSGANLHIEKYVEIVEEKQEDGTTIRKYKANVPDLGQNDPENKNFAQINDFADRVLASDFAELPVRKNIIRDYVVKNCENKTLGIPKLIDKLVDMIADSNQMDFVFGSWKQLVATYNYKSRLEDNVGHGEQIGKQKLEKDVLSMEDYENQLKTRFEKLVPKNFNTGVVQERIDTLQSRLSKIFNDEGIPMSFKLEDLWRKNESLTKIVINEGETEAEKEKAKQEFENEVNAMEENLKANIHQVHEREKAVSDSFAFNIHRGWVFSFIGSNLVRGNQDLVGALTDYSINRIMNDVKDHPETQRVEKIVRDALDEARLEDRWKISAMKALSTMIGRKDLDPKTMTKEQVIQNFNQWNETFNEKSKTFMDKYAGLYLSPAQIDSEITFFEENAWLEEKEFSAVIDSHIRNFKEAGKLHGEKQKGDVTIDQFLTTINKREEMYRPQNYLSIKEKLQEDLMNNADLKEVLGNHFSSKDLFSLLKESIRDQDVDLLPLRDLQENEIDKLTISQYNKLKTMAEQRLLPLAPVLKTVDKGALTTDMLNSCVKRALRGDLEITTAEQIVKEEMANAEYKEDIETRRRYIAFTSKGTAFGQKVNADKSRMQGSKGTRAREDNVQTAAKFWEAMWKENPQLAKKLSKAMYSLTNYMKNLPAKKLAKGKKDYTNEMYHNDYEAELKRFVDKLATDDSLDTSSEACLDWYRALTGSNEKFQTKLLSDTYSIADSVTAKQLKEIRAQVKDIMNKYALTPKQLQAACNELALMGNADILMGVGDKYEEAYLQEDQAYKNSLHGMAERIMEGGYGLLVTGNEQLDYDTIKNLRKPLIAVKDNESKRRQKLLAQDAKSIMKAGDQCLDFYKKNAKQICKYWNVSEEQWKFDMGTFDTLVHKNLSKFTSGAEGMNLQENPDMIIDSFNEYWRCLDSLSRRVESFKMMIDVINKNVATAQKDKNGNLTIEGKTYKYDEIHIDMSDYPEAMVLALDMIVKEDKVANEETIKEVLSQNEKDRQQNLVDLGVKDSLGAYSEYEKYKANVKISESKEEIYQAIAAKHKAYEGMAKTYQKNLTTLQMEDNVHPAAMKYLTFLPIMELDNRFIEVMTQDNEEKIKEYLTEFTEKIQVFKDAIIGPNGNFAFDMTNVVPQFIETHKEEILRGSALFQTKEDYANELKYIESNWQTLVTNGKSAQKTMNSKMKGIPEAETKAITQALLHEGRITFEEVSDNNKLQQKIKEYKAIWDENKAVIENVPSYIALKKIPLHGSEKENLTKMFQNTYRDKIITMDKNELLNIVSVYAAHCIEVNKSLANVSTKTNKGYNWNYKLEARIRDDLKEKQVAGRNAFAKGLSQIKDAEDCYYNGVSVLSNAYKAGDRKQNIDEKEFEKNKVKVREKLTALKAKKGEEVAITEDDLTLLTELYTTGAIWSSMPLLWKSNIDAAYDAIKELRQSITEIIKKDLEKKIQQAGGVNKTGFDDDMIAKDVQRYILFSAAHRLIYFNHEGDKLFLAQKWDDLTEWCAKFFQGKRTIHEGVEKNDAAKAAEVTYNSYRSIQGMVDAFDPVTLNLKDEEMIQLCNREQTALQMAMFTLEAKDFINLIEERKGYLQLADRIRRTVRDIMTKDNTLNLPQEEKEARILQVSDGLVDYYSTDIKSLISNVNDRDAQIKTAEIVKKRIDEINVEIGQKLEGQNKEYYYSTIYEEESRLAESFKKKGKHEDHRAAANIEDYKNAVSRLGSKRKEQFANLTEAEQNAIAIIIAEPFRFLSTDRVGSINMVMDHDAATNNYQHKEKNVEARKTTMGSVDIIALLSGSKMEKIDYNAAVVRLAGQLGKSGGRQIFDQAYELLGLIKDRMSYYKNRDWDTIDDPEKSIRLAKLLGKTEGKEKQPANVEAKNFKYALSNVVSENMKQKLANFTDDKLPILVTLLQNRSILDTSTLKEKNGRPANTLMREEVIRDLCTDEAKRSEYFNEANKDLYVNKAITTLFSYQVRDDAMASGRILSQDDMAEGALERKTAVDEKLLEKAMQLADKIKDMIDKPIEDAQMRRDQFNEVYRNDKVLSGGQTTIKYSADLDGILGSVNGLLKSRADKEYKFNVFKNKAGEKYAKYKDQMYQKWQAEYKDRLAKLKLDDEAKKAFEAQKEVIDQIVIPGMVNDKEIKLDKMQAA